MSKTEKLIKRIMGSFENAIVELDALNTYYFETKKTIVKIRNEYSTEYEAAFALAKLLDSIYDKKEGTRQEYIINLKTEKVQDDINVGDMVDIVLDENEKVQYKLKEPFNHNKKYDPVNARRKLCSLIDQETIFARAILSNIIILFEQFFEKQYKILVVTEPKKYFGEQKVSFSELLEWGFSKTIDNTIEKEVESNMFDSLKTLSKIKEKSYIDTDRYIPIRKEFEEIYYRRNVYIHAKGIANDIYIRNVDEKYRKNIALGDRLVCDNIYLENAILVVSKIISSLHFEMLKFMKVQQSEYTSLSMFGFDALQNQRYGLAEHIYGILRREPTFEFASKARYEINYINSIKLQGKPVDSLIEKLDFSIATDDFKIAKECLLDNHEMVYNMIKLSYPRSFTAEQIREWPLFIKFRESEYYAKLQEEYAEDFSTYLFEQDSACAD